MNAKQRKALDTNIKSAEVKIRKLSKKLSAQKTTISDLREELRAHRKKMSFLKLSRDNWKTKHKSRGLIIKGLHRRINRQDKAKRHHYPIWLVCLCTVLRTQAHVSYTSISKILVVLSSCFHLNLTRIPCANTVQNWVSKQGLSYLENCDNQLDSSEVCILIDESIRMGNERLLLALACPYKRHNQGSLTYSDVQVCYIGSSSSWTGELISERIKEVAQRQNWTIRYVLSDGGSNLKKATRLLDVVHVPDISHAIAHCLRSVFKENASYKSFVKLIGSYNSKMGNQDIGYLAPPKQRKKARFMNQKPLIKWTLALLDKYDRLNAKEATFFTDLSKQKDIVESMMTCLELGQKIALLIKTKGLNENTLKDCQAYLDISTKDSLVQEFIKRLLVYVQCYEQVLQTIPDTDLHACTDVIESMFGTYKQKVSKNPLVGLTLLGLEIPCWGKSPTKESMKNALETNFMSSLKDWIKTNAAESQAVKRVAFFEK